MRGKFILTVFVFIAFLPSVIFGQNVIQAASGTNQIDAALVQAKAGDIIELTTDGGVYNETLTTLIDVPVTIRAAAGLVNKPVWTCDAAGRLITLSADLTLDGIIFDGAQGASLTKDCIRIGSGIMGIDLIIDNCVFTNFSDGSDGHAIKGPKDAQVDSLTVTNSRFEHMPGEHISFKDNDAAIPPGPVKYIRVEYCTFWDGQNEVIYVDDNDGDSSTDPQPEFLVNHLTVVSVGSKAIYPKEINGAVIKNTISVNNGEYPARIYNTNSVAEYILFNNCPKDYISRQDDATVNYDLLLQNQNPYFADVENGDFAVAEDSPAALFADDGTALGDTNNGTWDAAAITNWEIVENKNWGNLIKKAVTDGDTITFVTDGGDYYSPGSNSFPLMTLSFLAKPGLETKPTLTTAYNTSYTIKVKGPTTLKGLNFVGDGMLKHPDSTKDAGPYLFTFEDENNDFGTTIVEDCEFSRCRLRAIHTDDKNTTDTLIVNNCVFKEIGETAVYGKEAVRNIDFAKITNCTFYKIGQNGIYLRDVGNLEVSHCTFFFGDSTLTNRHGMAIRARDDTVVVIRNNIIAKFEKGMDVYGSNPVVEYNLFWNILKDWIDPSDTTLVFPIFNFEDDPMFKDTSAANLDLALHVNSPAVGAASDGTNLGDPRWGTWGDTDVEKNVELPRSYSISQNYPNPFNPETAISYNLPRSSDVQLSVYNLLGKKIVTLVNKKQNAGVHTIYWDATDDLGARVASGVYFYRIQAGDFKATKKMLILK